MDNFRKPNFELVADILFWMVKLYDPDTALSDRVEYESERVEFLTSIAALMASKARLKLNTKKIYAAGTLYLLSHSLTHSLTHSFRWMSSVSMLLIILWR